MGARAFSSRSVGFLGLGNMGLPMARNLQASGFKVKGYDIGEKPQEAAKEAGLTVVNSIAEASSDVDYVVTSLPKTEHVRQVLHQEGGIFESARKGTVICDTSTIAPTASVEFA